MYDSNQGDVTILLADENRELHFQSEILKVNSEVFAKMLDENFQVGKDKIIDLTNYSSMNVERMMKYIFYRNNEPSTHSSVDASFFELYT